MGAVAHLICRFAGDAGTKTLLPTSVCGSTQRPHTGRGDEHIHACCRSSRPLLSASTLSMAAATPRTQPSSPGSYATNASEYGMQVARQLSVVSWRMAHCLTATCARITGTLYSGHLEEHVLFQRIWWRSSEVLIVFIARATIGSCRSSCSQATRSTNGRQANCFRSDALFRC